MDARAQHDGPGRGGAEGGTGRDVSRGEFRESLVAGQGCGEAEEGEEVAAFSFVPDGEAAVAEEPGDRPLDLPAVLAEPLAGLDTGTGDPRDEVPAAEPAEVLRRVVRLVACGLQFPYHAGRHRHEHTVAVGRAQQRSADGVEFQRPARFRVALHGGLGVGRKAS